MKLNKIQNILNKIIIIITMTFKHLIIIFILSFLFNKKILINSRLSNQFAERICSKAKYFPSPNSYDFSTSYNYYIDQRMKTTKMFDFMLSSLSMEQFLITFLNFYQELILQF